jgi:hypothetical protein
VNRKTGERFYWKIRKIIKKERAPVPEPASRPGLMSEEDDALLLQEKRKAIEDDVQTKLEEGELEN